MEIIIGLTILALVIFSIIGAVKKKAAEAARKQKPAARPLQEETIEYHPPLTVTLKPTYSPSFEGQSEEEASVPPVPTVVAAGESVKVPSRETNVAANPLGLFSDAQECVKAVIYSEILKPKYK